MVTEGGAEEGARRSTRLTQIRRDTEGRDGHENRRKPAACFAISDRLWKGALIICCAVFILPSAHILVTMPIRQQDRWVDRHMTAELAASVSRVEPKDC
jgi:hypothetical protein